MDVKVQLSRIYQKAIIYEAAVSYAGMTPRYDRGWRAAISNGFPVRNECF